MQVAAVRVCFGARVHRAKLLCLGLRVQWTACVLIVVVVLGGDASAQLQRISVLSPSSPLPLVSSPRWSFLVFALRFSTYGVRCHTEVHMGVSKKGDNGRI